MTRVTHPKMVTVTHLTHDPISIFGEGRVSLPKIFFSGNYRVKFGYFSCKCCAKFGNFVNLSCTYFRAKMSCPLKLTELIPYGCNIVCLLPHAQNGSSRMPQS